MQLFGKNLFKSSILTPFQPIITRFCIKTFSTETSSALYTSRYNSVKKIHSDLLHKEKYQEKLTSLDYIIYFNELYELKKVTGDYIAQLNSNNLKDINQNDLDQISNLVDINGKEIRSLWLKINSKLKNYPVNNKQEIVNFLLSVAYFRIGMSLKQKGIYNHIYNEILTNYDEFSNEELGLIIWSTVRINYNTPITRSIIYRTANKFLNNTIDDLKAINHVYIALNHFDELADHQILEEYDLFYQQKVNKYK